MSSWRELPLDILASVAVSTVDKKQYEGEVPVRLCNYTDVYYNDLITDEIDFMEATATSDQIEWFSVCAGDVVITKDSETSDDIGRPAYVPHALPGVVYGYHLAIYRPFDARYGRYLRYVFDSTIVRAELARRTPGVTRVGLSQDTLRNLRVLAPCPVEASLIADYLDHETAEIDAFIADLRRLSELEAERINVEIDLSFRAYSEHLVPLKRLGVVQDSGVSVNGVAWPATGSEPGVLRTGAVSKGYFDSTENKAVVEPEERERLATPVLADSLIVNRANTPDLVGRGVYVRHAHPNLYLSDLLWRVQVGGGCTEYVGAWMASRAYADSIARIRVGASATMQKISFNSFSRIRLPVPDEPTRRELAIRVNELRRGRARFEADIDAAITLAKERRAALITAAVTGQIDVSSRRKPVVDSIQTAIEEAR